MGSDYVKALETRANWLHWALNRGGAAWQDMGYYYILPAYIKALESGDTFFMNRPFCDLINHARETVPDELAFDSKWLQAKHGWLWLEEPFTVPMIEWKSLGNGELQLLAQDAAREGVNIPLKVRAIGWFPIPEGTQTGAGNDDNQPGKPRYPGRIAGPNAYEILCYQSFTDYRRNAEGFGCWSYFMLQDGDKLIDRIGQFESAAKERGGAYIDRNRDSHHEIRWVYSAFYMMAQRLATSVKRDTDRATRRRGEHTNRPVTPFIRLITLRRLEEARKKDPKGAHVDWQWQWEVRGHWRNQYFPSTGEHKPVFIEAYIKGPDDKPLKNPGVKIFQAVR